MTKEICPCRVPFSCRPKVGEDGNLVHGTNPVLDLLVYVIETFSSQLRRNRGRRTVTRGESSVRFSTETEGPRVLSSSCVIRVSSVTHTVPT